MEKDSRMAKGIRNVKSGITLQLISVFFSFFVRSAFIYSLGEYYLGVDGLFSSIMSLLSVAELGAGTVFAYSLFQPAEANDYGKINALLVFYKKIYRVIGSVILILGVVVAFLYTFLTEIFNNQNKSLYFIFCLYLVNSAISYFLFAYKKSLFVAYQNVYIISRYETIIRIVCGILNFGVLVKFRNYFMYILIQILSTLLINIMWDVVSKKEFPKDILKRAKELSWNDKKIIYKNMYASGIWSVGNQALVATDNILINSFLGTIQVGYFSNYSMIFTVLVGLYGAVLNSILPSIGNMNVSDDTETQLRSMKNMHFVHFCVLCYISIAIMVTINPLISLWTMKTGNSNYVMGTEVAIAVGINFFTTWHMGVVGLFKNSKGLFWYGKNAQLIMGVVNVILSIFCGRYFGVVGILLATSVCHIAFAYEAQAKYLFLMGFNTSASSFAKDVLVNFFVFGSGAVVTIGVCNLIECNVVVMILIRLIITFIVLLVICVLVYRKSEYISLLLLLIKNRMRANRVNK